jgi:hypothetical protein
MWPQGRREACSVEPEGLAVERGSLQIVQVWGIERRGGGGLVFAFKFDVTGCEWLFRGFQILKNILGELEVCNG